MAGTYVMSREFLDDPLFAPEPFTEREAFMWMIAEAAWRPHTTRIGNRMIDLDRGQFAHSVRFMAEKWRWSKSRVSRFILKFVKLGKIGTDTGTGVLRISVRNYDRFQLQPEAERDTSRDTSGTAAGQQRDREEYTWNSTGIQKEESPLSSPEGDKPAKKFRKRKTDGNPARYSPEFETFMAAFPRPVGRGEAWDVWQRLPPKVRADIIKIAVPAYAAQMRAEERKTPYIKTPAAWLNARRYDDYITWEPGDWDWPDGKDEKAGSSGNGTDTSGVGLDHPRDGGMDSVEKSPNGGGHPNLFDDDSREAAGAGDFRCGLAALGAEPVAAGSLPARGGLAGWGPGALPACDALEGAGPRCGAAHAGEHRPPEPSGGRASPHAATRH